VPAQLITGFERPLHHSSWPQAASFAHNSISPSPAACCRCWSAPTSSRACRRRRCCRPPRETRSTRFGGTQYNVAVHGSITIILTCAVRMGWACMRQQATSQLPDQLISRYDESNSDRLLLDCADLHVMPGCRHLLQHGDSAMDEQYVSSFGERVWAGGSRGQRLCSPVAWCSGVLVAGGSLS
jgi:hypothetical protein